MHDHPAFMHHWLPSPLSWGCDLTQRGGGFPGHVHTHDEICLVANHGSLVRHAGIERQVRPGTVFLFRRGEDHGYRNSPQQEPHLWLVHYQADEALYRDCPRLCDPNPERRVWLPSEAQLAAWQAVFTRLMAESMQPRANGHAAAMSAWLRLLLVQTARWDDAGVPEPTEIAADPQLAHLWEVINQHIEAPEADFNGALAHQVKNYDSLRHRFKRIYGRPPRELLTHLRLERAKYLLLETTSPVRDIASRLGYARQAEFTRAFVRRVGLTPSAFRQDPQTGFTLSEPASS
jgi:hypothetical protein